LEGALLPVRRRAAVTWPFDEVKRFGSNPGNLRMFVYLPARLRPGAPLVVVLHGCHQTAPDFGLTVGWTTLAEEHRFALLLPEQLRANNRNACFTWFQAYDTTRGQGEALSIREMIDWIVVERRLDEHQIFITGLSAGGAMTSAMLANYPEIFRAGAIIAGLPFGIAVNVRQAIAAMANPPVRSADEWGDYVRQASPHKGHWPAVSIWHGSADTVVSPNNAEAIGQQWCNVHGLGDTFSDEQIAPGVIRRHWLDESGRTLVERVDIPGFGHGAPIDALGRNGAACGVPGPFALDVGISSTRAIAKFFGLSQRREMFGLDVLKQRLFGG
jgi:poly(hydroxyalkanoate) depolymerase family esterase